jgi:hypothetical protein
MADDQQKPPPVNVYTAMLVLSFLAIAVGCVMLALALGEYGFQIQPPPGSKPT